MLIWLVKAWPNPSVMLLLFDFRTRGDDPGVTSSDAGDPDVTARVGEDKGEPATGTDVIWGQQTTAGEAASRGGAIFIPPRNEVRGVYWNHHVRLSVRPSVRLSVCPAAFGFPAHNCFPFTPIIMKLHMQTPHEARMCPIDFEVKRSKVKVTMHNYWK